MMIQLFGHAETSASHSWRSLRTKRYAAPPEEIARRLKASVPAMPRWNFVGYDKITGTIHLEHVTPIGGFTDDILLHLQPDGDGTSVSGRSRSRVGSFDFGVNMMNLRSILRALDRVMAAPPVRAETAGTPVATSSGT
ncbi:MAG: hypothetical protein JWQ98_3072 [Chlorobi bacterium]|nr:hypothetical protein [Chlorobiota bacterium]